MSAPLSIRTNLISGANLILKAAFVDLTEGTSLTTYVSASSFGNSAEYTCLYWDSQTATGNCPANVGIALRIVITPSSSISGFVPVEIVRTYMPAFTTVYASQSVTPMVIIEQQEIDETSTTTAPVQYSLSQNYPNPFNPSTHIAFSIPEETDVRISVYDLVGREVALLLDASLPRGAYVVVWNASDRPSGMYMCKMTTASFTQTRMMMLVK
jgi:methionine-rich copper-binding protein CopC